MIIPVEYSSPKCIRGFNYTSYQREFITTFSLNPVNSCLKGIAGSQDRSDIIILIKMMWVRIEHKCQDNSITYQTVVFQMWVQVILTVKASVSQCCWGCDRDTSHVFPACVVRGDIKGCWMGSILIMQNQILLQSIWEVHRHNHFLRRPFFSGFVCPKLIDWLK